MWTSLFPLLVSCTAVLSSPPNPINVTFASENFRNILLWSPGHGTPADTKYSVRYAIYGDNSGLEKRVHWRPVLRCTEISRPWCDLSVETSDLEHGYYARVRAVSRKGKSKWVETFTRFDPMINTEFGPPHVSVEVDDKYAVVKLKGPMRFLPRNHTTQVSMATLYRHMTYDLSMKNTRSGMIRRFTLTGEQFKYRFLDHGTEYCFSANTKIEDRPMSSKHHPSGWHCIATPEVPLIDRLEKMVIISTTVPVSLLCLLGAGGYVLHKYLSGKDQKSSDILKLPAVFPPPWQATPESFNTIVIYNHVEDDLPLNKLYPELSNTPIPNPWEGYKKQEWQIEGVASSTQSSSLQASSAPAADPVSLNSSGENQQFLRRASESSNVISSPSYASQTAQPAEPTHQVDDLPDDYGFVGVAGEGDAADLCSQEHEDEDTGVLHLNWSPTSQTLLLPDFDLGIGQREVRGRPNLETVFVRQPSEEDALLGGERSPSGQWDPEEFMAKWGLNVSNN